MASRIKQVASQPVAALIRKNNDEKEDPNSSFSGRKSSSMAMTEFNPYSYTDKRKLSLTNTLETFQAINHRIMLDHEFVISFLKQYADTSILRNVPTMTMASSLPPTTTTYTGVNAPSQHIQHQVAMVSAQLTTDILSLSLRTNLPMTLIKREYIRYKRRKRMQALPKPKLSQLRMNLLLHNPPPPLSDASCLTGKVNGLPNYSSTCFLNSVLQALASSTPFVRYLERVAHIEAGLERMGMRSEGNVLVSSSFPTSRSLGFFSPPEPISRLLLEIILYINNAEGHEERSAVHRKIRQILDRIASENEQFKSYKHHHSKEQQDAQELLQALISLVIEESRLEDDDDDDLENFELDEGDGNSHAHDLKSPTKGYSLFSESELYRDEGAMTPPQSLTNLSHSGDENEETRLLTTCDAIYVEKEEKKEDDGDSDGNCEEATNILIESRNEIQSAYPEPVLGTVTGAKARKESGYSKSIQMMVASLSSKTPSPLSGCMSSRLQCYDCKHTRRVNESPFLEIPVVPTAVSKRMGINYNQPCRLEDCLKEFAESERVQGVNCRACTIQSELAALREERNILDEAINSIVERGSDKMETLALREELKLVSDRCDFLTSIDPDEDVEIMEEELDVCGSDRSIPAPRKADHEKRLILTRLPPVLCLHVKRLYFNPTTNQMSKSTQHIEFQEYLELNDLYAGDVENEEHCEDLHNNPGEEIGSPSQPNNRHSYKLMSVIEHRGSAFAGHYVTYRRVAPTSLLSDVSTSNNWAFVSDETISFITWKDVQKCSAYMMIYEAI